MPFLARYPKEIKAGSVIDDIISNIDFAPTLLDYAGLDKTGGMQGRSFRSNAAGNQPADWPNRIYYRYWMHMAHHDNPAHYGIRTKDFKLIFFYGLPLDSNGALPEPTPAGWELYDLRNDPRELNNVYNDPGYREIVRELKKQLVEIKKDAGDEDEEYPEVLKRQLL